MRRPEGDDRANHQGRSDCRATMLLTEQFWSWVIHRQWSDDSYQASLLAVSVATAGVVSGSSAKFFRRGGDGIRRDSASRAVRVFLSEVVEVRCKPLRSRAVGSARGALNKGARTTIGTLRKGVRTVVGLNVWRSNSGVLGLSCLPHRSEGADGIRRVRMP